MENIRERSAEKIFTKAEKRLRQEKRKVKLLDVIIKKTLKDIENAEKTYINNKGNIRKRGKN